MKDIIVIYHGDCIDGFTAAYAAWKKLGDSADYFAGLYGEPAPDVTGKTVYILDYSFKTPVMKELAKQAKQIIILDHHKSAYEDLQHLIDDGTLQGKFDMAHSGAMMAWMYFHGEDNIPEFVKYIEDRDLWKLQMPYSKAFNQAVFSYKYDFQIWEELVTQKTTQEMIAEGMTILRKHFKDIDEFKTHAFTMNIGGYDVPTVNVNYTYGSDIGNQLAEGQLFAAYFWVNKNGKFVFGLRSKESGLDVSKIAVQYGGGGHEHASGFQVDNLKDVEKFKKQSFWKKILNFFN